MPSLSLLAKSLLAFAAAISTVTARSVSGDRILVVLEQQLHKDDYSSFWQSLEARGFRLFFKTPKDDTARLVEYGEIQYDHLIMYAPSTKAFTPGLSPQAIVEAQLAGVNTLHLLSSNISEIHRDTFREYDIEFVERDSVFIDAFSHHERGQGIAYLRPSSSLTRHDPILSDDTLTGGPLVYPEGTVHTLGDNPYLIDILHGSPSGYVGEILTQDSDDVDVEQIVGKGGKDAVVTGAKAVLISAMQTRDNVRVGLVGSGEMFSNQWWNVDVVTTGTQTSKTGNAGLAEDFSKWVFQETGVVKIVETTHFRQGETRPRDMYRVKDDLTFSITLAQHATTQNGTSSWKPFSTPDLQLDFAMLDPHIRIALTETDQTASSSATTYTAKFRAPDRHGVFKFVVEHWRPGWTYIRSSSTASVVPFRHDEYPRFIKGAYPFYTSTFSVTAAFLLFCAVWVRLGAVDSKGKKKAE